VLGFGSYTISTAAFLWSSEVREQYARRHIDSPESTVRLNDFAFAAHGFLLCAITYSQFYPTIWGIRVDQRQRASRVVLGIVFGSLVAIALSIIFVLVPGSNENGVKGWEWLDVVCLKAQRFASKLCTDDYQVYTLGYVKLICTIVKYCPQVYLNYKRQSTVGWSISQILLDFSGGILSLLQLIIDCALQADWSGTWGNLPKLGLSNISLFFDIIFIVQHYMLVSTFTRSLNELLT
jgi:cystinosin